MNANGYCGNLLWQRGLTLVPPKPLCVLLRDIGAVLEDKSSDDGAAFCAAEMKKANAELKAIAADVKKTIKTGFGEVKRGIAEVGEKVDAVDEKVSKSRRGKRRGKRRKNG